MGGEFLVWAFYPRIISGELFPTTQFVQFVTTLQHTHTHIHTYTQTYIYIIYIYIVIPVVEIIIYFVVEVCRFWFIMKNNMFFEKKQVIILYGIYSIKNFRYSSINSIIILRLKLFKLAYGSSL